MDSQYLVFTDEVSRELEEFCRKNNISRVVTVSDSNTYSILGSEINDALSEAGIATKAIILNGNGLIADERAVMSVLVDMDREAQAMVSVGSGTITDITRFVSHRMQKEFISVPTAPSVDGYSSSGAPLVIKGFKQSIRCHAPRVIFASLPILASAPREMIAAGFGDILGKITALADWELSQLLVGNRFDREIAEANLRAYHSVVERAPGIAKRDPEAIRVLFEALTYTGESIRRFGSSEPASGSEHFISHFIEMHHLVEKRPALLHGAKVALSTIVSAGWYEMLRSFTKDQIAKLPVEVPDYEADAREIRRILGEPGELILESNSFLSTLSQQQVVGIRALLLDHWDEVQRIARQVPNSEELKGLMKSVGGPREPADLGLTDMEVEQAARLSHYVRSRFTISTLFFTLGIPLFPKTHPTP